MKKIKDFIKRNYLIIIAVICFFAFIPPITNLLVTTPSPIGFITPDAQETWIGFFGSIIGGGTTLFGVWWTIKEQTRQRREDLAIQYMPHICCSINSIKSVNNSIFISIKLKNIGRGEAKKFHFTAYDPENNIFFQRNEDCIFMNNSPDSELELEIEIEMNEGTVLPNDVSVYIGDFTLECEYTDLIYLEHYKQKTIVTILRNENNEIEYIPKSVFLHNSIV